MDIRKYIKLHTVVGDRDSVMQDVWENEIIQFVMEYSVPLNKKYELPTLYQVIC